MIPHWTPQNFPPPGQAIEVEGYKLHLQSSGEANGRPTVILEAGLLAMSAIWAWIQPEMATMTRVVSYDRPGLGWSEPNGHPPDARRIARTLRAALDKAGIEPPYLLVGHSIGGQLVRVFTDLYPEEVVGLILVDSSHPDQMTLAPVIAGKAKKLFGQLRFLPILARWGILRLTGLMNSMVKGLPPRQQAEAVACCSSARHLETSRDEALAWEFLTSQVRESRIPRDLPLTVLTADSATDPDWEGWYALQADLVTLSSRGQHRIIPRSDHLSLLTERQDARSVVSAIGEMLETVSVQHETKTLSN